MLSSRLMQEERFSGVRRQLSLLLANQLQSTDRIADMTFSSEELNFLSNAFCSFPVWTPYYGGILK